MNKKEIYKQIILDLKKKVEIFNIDLNEAVLFNIILGCFHNEKEFDEQSAKELIENIYEMILAEYQMMLEKNYDNGFWLIQ